MGQEMGQGAQVVVAQRIDHIGHRGDAAAHPLAGLELAQRLEQVVLALPGQRAAWPARRRNRPCGRRCSDCPAPPCGRPRAARRRPWPRGRARGGFCDANQAARLRMSSSLSVAAIGCITGLLRVPVRKNTSCHCRKPSGWPASDGVSAIWEMPAGPWQGAQVSALALPAARSTAATAASPRAMRLRGGQFSGSWSGRYQQKGPPGCGGPGRRILARGPRGATRSAVPPVGRIRLCRSCPHTLNPTLKNRAAIFLSYLP